MADTTEPGKPKVFLIGYTDNTPQPGPVVGLTKADFERVAGKLKNCGLDPILPAELTIGAGSKESLFRSDVTTITECNLVYLMPGYSSGEQSNILRMVAGALQLPVITGISGT